MRTQNRIFIDIHSTMNWKLVFTIISVSWVSIQSQAQHSHHNSRDQFVKKDLSHYIGHVASQTNPDYFNHHDHDLWTYFMNKAHPSVNTLTRYFDEAAQTYGVPAALLKAIGRVESNWTQIGPSIDRGWGIMHLVQNEYANTLQEAARLTGLSEELLKEDPQANIQGAAALLAHFAGPDLIGNPDIRLWFEASKSFTALAIEELRISQAQLYFKKLQTGDRSQTVWGETIQLKAHASLDIPQNKNTNQTSKKAVSADYPPAISFITPCNFGTGRSHIIDTWVNHWIGVGTYAGAISWFHTCRPNSPSSAHFVIRSSDGEITQVVRVSNTAYHTGASGFPLNNARSIGIEHEATATEPNLWNSETMLNASTTMACYFSEIYPIPQARGLPGIREHNEMPGTNTDCAGSIPWSTWMNKFTSCVNGGPLPSLDCSTAIPIDCGVTYAGAASTIPSNVDSYGCNTWTETGPERVHTLISPGYGTLTATLSNFTGDLDVYILKSCDPNDCVGTVTSNQATFDNAIAGQVYYIVVDADDGSGSAYDLIVNRPSGGTASGLDCANAIPLQCGVSYTGPSSSASSAVGTYSCNSWTETGPERVHIVTPTASGELTASLSNYTGDLDVYILNSCDPDDCIGTVNSDDASYPNAIAGQSYYIVVDADDGSGSGYDLLVDCERDGLACADAIPLVCGVRYSGSSSTSPSYVDTYGCNNWTETGPERLHTVTPTANGALTASLSNYSGDLDVYILNSCDPNDCIGTVSSESATFSNAIAGQSYYIVVDADDGSGSSYDLIVNCPSSNCENELLVSGVYQQDETFQALQHLQTDATFLNSSNIVMHAGESVELIGGFTIEGGTAIHVYIEACDQN